MRLHLAIPAISLSLTGVLLGGLALADGGDVQQAPKPLEAQRPANVRAGKVRALFSPQAQLFVEQKDAPTLSKTALRLDSSPRLSDKSKD